MNKEDLIRIIKGGESRSVDFKLQLNIDTKKEKSEFIKDIISLANSAVDLGYLIIGIRDNKDYVGCETLPEERIQQIAHRYISPPININIYDLDLDDKNISVICIKSTKKPHKVTWDIDKLEQHTVFVRHGTIIKKATPEEIILLSETSSQLPINKKMGITHSDSLVLKLSAEHTITENNIFLNLETITRKTYSMGISLEATKESIELLDRKGFILITPTTGPLSYTITTKGIEEYANAHFPDYEKLQTSVIELLVKVTDYTWNNEISKKLKQSEIMIDHILCLLEINEYIELVEHGAAGNLVQNISPELNRLLDS